MKHYSFLIITCLLLCNVALGEVVANLEGKCGYKDANGDLIIDYLYDFMSDFSDHDLAIVRNGLKFGMVDRQGNVVLPLSYTEIGPFNNGVAIVKNGDKMGIISEYGQLLHEPVYEFIYPFNSYGIAKALVHRSDKDPMLYSKNTYALLRLDGKVLYKGKGDDLGFFTRLGRKAIAYVENDTMDLTTGFFFSYNSQKWFNLDGNVVLDDNKRDSLYKSFFGDRENRRNAYELLPNKEFSPTDGIMSLHYSNEIDEDHAKQVVAYFDLHNQQIIWEHHFNGHRVYDQRKRVWRVEADNEQVDIHSFQQGFAIVTVTGTDEDNGDYIINRQGQDLARFGAHSCYPYRYGWMQARDENGFFGLIDRQQQVVVPFQYEEAKPITEQGLWATRKNGKWGVVNTNNTILVPHRYDEVRAMPDSRISFFRIGAKWGAYDGDSLILECIYDSLYSYFEGVFTYCYGEQYGMYSSINHYMSPTHDGYEGIFTADSTYHGGQMRKFFIINKKGIKFYGFLNAYGQKAVPFMFTDRDQAAEAYIILRSQPVKTFSRLDRLRMRLRLSRLTRTYSLSAKVPDADWDY